MIPAPTASTTLTMSEMTWSYVIRPQCHVGACVVKRGSRTTAPTRPDMSRRQGPVSEPTVVYTGDDSGKAERTLRFRERSLFPSGCRDLNPGPLDPQATA